MVSLMAVMVVPAAMPGPVTVMPTESVAAVVPVAVVLPEVIVVLCVWGTAWAALNLFSAWRSASGRLLYCVALSAWVGPGALVTVTFSITPRRVRIRKGVEFATCYGIIKALPLLCRPGRSPGGPTPTATAPGTATHATDEPRRRPADQGPPPPARGEA